MSALECHYCGLVHQLVEAGGVYHCPNRLCTGPGAWRPRMKLSSYKEADGCYTVDPLEVLESVRANTSVDLAVWIAESKLVKRWVRLAADDKSQQDFPSDVGTTRLPKLESE